MRAGSGLLRLCALPYRQGQRPEPGIREYFYYVDHQGQLFLDDARVKNFTSCYRDVAFLSFFFSRLRPNPDSRYRSRFPFVARCGRERNFLRCADTPVVFTHLLPAGDSASAEDSRLSFCGGGASLAVPFRPRALALLPENGRLYHPAPANAGGVGLVRWELAAEWSEGFEFGEGGKEEEPTYFWWGGKRYRLGGEEGERVRERRRRMGRGEMVEGGGGES